jgi:hypothetical protein
LRQRSDGGAVLRMPTVPDVAVLIGPAAQLSDLQLSLFRSNNVKRPGTFGGGATVGLRGCRLRRLPGPSRSLGARSMRPAVSAAPFSRNRKTFPSTAERESPPRRRPMAAAVAPSDHNFRSKVMPSSVHTLPRMPPPAIEGRRAHEGARERPKAGIGFGCRKRSGVMAAASLVLMYSL